ncbi:uncharacterized protein LOC132913946 isoform X3 [Bombus pascuorum]|uniref:uncharacterized protein LOC132913946 isoform X3 n=1 Tax=Bombus pascuorum TaxID=65598 RepID=UPI00298E1C5F|nr:uncharacterized protein LOC132913946 isoform X3 [Bombus pascuorum]
MEIKRNEPRPDELEENPFLWTICKTGVPRILATSLFAVGRYCADQLPKKMGLGSLRILAAFLVIVMPRSLTYILLYPIFRLVFGNLYPAYASYKAVRTKNVKEYVKWMMYWIVFALFTCAETFTDVFFSFWFPFYYEIKTILVIWLLSPATKGSSILYRRFVHPALIRREAEIDDALARATEQGYSAVLHLGSKGVNYATTVLMQTAIKGGGGLVQHLKKSYSLSDLTGEKEDENRNTPHMHDETDMEVEPRRREHVGRRGYSPRRTQSSTNRVEMYFSEVDVDVLQPRSREPTASLTNIRSSDDISSGYSSGEALQSSRTSQGDSLVRTSSVGARTRAKPRSTTKKTPEDSGEDSDSIDPPSSKNVSFPTPLNLITPEQALEILFLLSKNSNVADYMKFDRGTFTAGNDDLFKSTSQSGPPQLEKKETTETIDNSRPEPTENTIENITNNFTRDEASSEKLTERSTRTVTDELCQDKFDELKQLLNDARKAVNNIVHTQEKLQRSVTPVTERLSSKDSSQNVDVETANENENVGKDGEGAKASSERTKEVENTADDKDAVNMAPEYDSASYLDVWTTPSVSRSNSDSLGRAGKYNKRPAPKVPLTESEEDLNETDAQSALKATLVIKTGTLKTFSNTGTTKDVFIAHATGAKSKGKKCKKQRTKEGFSKLLAIPKNIFHSAFSKERKASKTDDSSSDISTSDTRSNSIEPQETIIELAPKPSSSGQEINVQNDDKSENYISDSSNSSDTYVLAPSDDKEDANKTENDETKKVTEEKVESASVESRIREASLSPKIGKRLESDIF